MFGLSFREIVKALDQMRLGVTGIISNNELTAKRKWLLLSDYLNLTFKLLLTILLKKKYTKVIIRAFDLKIHLANYPSFFYLFNEIFCRDLYRSKINVKNYIDAGAHIGLAILWFHVFNPDMKIKAFEPDGQSYKLLIRNLKENNIRNYETYNLALSNEIAERDFYIIKHPIQCLNNSLFIKQELPFTTVQVKVEKLSNFISERVSLLKMDIEGAEFNVIEDLLSSDKIKKTENIIVEVHYFSHKEKEDFFREVERLRGLGEVKITSYTDKSSIIYFKGSKGSIWSQMEYLL